jgi:hypothetical protein
MPKKPNLEHASYNPRDEEEDDFFKITFGSSNEGEILKVHLDSLKKNKTVTVGEKTYEDPIELIKHQYGFNELSARAILRYFELREMGINHRRALHQATKSIEEEARKQRYEIPNLF